MARCRKYGSGAVGACLAVGLLVSGGVSIAAAPESTEAPAAPAAGVPLAPSTNFTLRYVDVVACAPKHRPVKAAHRRVHRAARVTPVRAYTPVHRRPLPDFLRKGRPVRCEVERRSPFTTPAVADGAPATALPVGLPVAPTGAIASLPTPVFQEARAEGAGPAPFANLPPITGAGARENRLIRTIPTAPVSAAPEPAAWTLLLLGVACIGAALRRRRPAQAAEA